MDKHKPDINHPLYGLGYTAEEGKDIKAWIWEEQVWNAIFWSGHSDYNHKPKVAILGLIKNGSIHYQIWLERGTTSVGVFPTDRFREWGYCSLQTCIWMTLSSNGSPPPMDALLQWMPSSSGCSPPVDALLQWMPFSSGCPPPVDALPQWSHRWPMLN